MKNGTIPFFSVFGKQKTGQSRENGTVGKYVYVKQDSILILLMHLIAFSTRSSSTSLSPSLNQYTNVGDQV